MTSFEKSRRTLTNRLAVLLVLLIAWTSWQSVQELPRVVDGFPYFVAYVRGMFPPDFRILPALMRPLIETLSAAISGVGLAALIAAPLSFLVARNVNPWLPLYGLGRGFINLLRSLPALLWAILFVSMVGLGPLAGLFAIVTHCVGTFGKLFSEAIETTGPKIGPVMEAMRLDGADEKQVIWYGLLPELAPLFAGYVVYYVEWAVRAGTILGLVGAGGIGLELTMAIRSFRRQEVCAILIIILVLVTVVDQISRHVREKLL
jgi:phosphonate transport system permease protein